MTDNDDILKQLLRTNGYDLLREEPIYVNPDGPKAADEIKRLRAILGKAVEFLVQMELEGEITSAVPLRMLLAMEIKKGGGDE